MWWQLEGSSCRFEFQLGAAVLPNHHSFFAGQHGPAGVGGTQTEGLGPEGIRLPGADIVFSVAHCQTHSCFCSRGTCLFPATLIYEAFF